MTLHEYLVSLNVYFKIYHRLIFNPLSLLVRSVFFFHFISLIIRYLTTKHINCNVCKMKLFAISFSQFKIDNDKNKIHLFYSSWHDKFFRANLNFFFLMILQNCFFFFFYSYLIHLHLYCSRLFFCCFVRKKIRLQLLNFVFKKSKKEEIANRDLVLLSMLI